MPYTKLIKNIVAIAILLITVATSAQKKWSLQDCIHYALEHNLQIKNYSYTKDISKEAYRQSIRNLLPRIEAFSDYNIRYGRSVNPNDNSITNSDFFSNNYSLNGSLDLFQGFKKMNELKASKFLYKATKEEETQQKFLLSFRVMNAYYDMIYFQEMVLISKEQLAISKSNYDLVKKQIELGIKAGADLYETKSTLLKDEGILTQNENNVQLAQLKLQQEMNFEAPNRIMISIESTNRELPTTNAEDVHNVYHLAKETIPILKAQQLRLQAAKKTLAAERGRYYPNLSMYVSRGSGYYETNVDSNRMTKSFHTQINENMSSRIGIQVQIPIFNNGATRSRVKQQKITWFREQNNLKIQEQALLQEVQRLVQENNALKIQVHQTSNQILVQEQAFRVAQKKYEKGLLNIMQLNQAKNLYAASKNENLQTQLKFKINTSTLDFYKGISTINMLMNN